MTERKINPSRPSNFMITEDLVATKSCTVVLESAVVQHRLKQSTLQRKSIRAQNGWSFGRISTFMVAVNGYSVNNQHLYWFYRVPREIIH